MSEGSRRCFWGVQGSEELKLGQDEVLEIAGPRGTTSEPQERLERRGRRCTEAGKARGVQENSQTHCWPQNEDPSELTLIWSLLNKFPPPPDSLGPPPKGLGPPQCRWLAGTSNTAPLGSLEAKEGPCQLTEHCRSQKILSKPV